MNLHSVSTVILKLGGLALLSIVLALGTLAFLTSGHTPILIRSPGRVIADMIDAGSRREFDLSEKMLMVVGFDALIYLLIIIAIILLAKLYKSR
jgi:hypothetical protein